MASDAMDWNPTTPPTCHNPYSHPQYMPGGWPESPPPFRYASGVFAQKRRAGVIERAVKRVCTGIQLIGVAATLPAKPVHLIIRHFRSRNQQRPRRALRSPPRAARPQQSVVLAERPSIAQATQPEFQQTVAHPSRSPIACTSPENQDPIREDLNIAHSSASSRIHVNGISSGSPITDDINENENATIPTGISSRDPTPSTGLRRRFRVGVKRRKWEPVNNADMQPIVAEPEAISKEMKGLNRFDSGFKRSLTAYGSRGLTPGLRLKAIGTRSQIQTKNKGVWGGWVHERPIRFNETPETITSEVCENEAQALKPSCEAMSAEKDDQLPMERLVKRNDKTATEEEPEVEVEFDERWSSVPLTDAWIPDEVYDRLDALKRTADPQKFLLDEEERKDHTSEILGKLFHGRRVLDTPPIVRPPFTSSNHFLRSTKLRPVKVENPAAADCSYLSATNDNEAARRTDSPAPSVPLGRDVPEVNVDGTDSTTDTAVLKSEATEQIDTVNETEAALNCLVENSGSTALPVTPLKATTENPTKGEANGSTALATKTGFETPAERLFKLSLEDRTDNDTPKATPHSGTKTTRVTRYREALEKAQKAKLEQYEIVPISSDWDQKVRAAVRSGIPDYLGPHDLARVVPQYASRGQDNWLNDETINKYLELVAEHGRKNDRPDQVRTHHTFNNFFYNNLRSKGPESVARWSKRAKIGGSNLAYVEKIFVPINSGAHWTLAVVEPAQKRITHYNSMRGAGTGMRACEDLKNWVAFEQGKAFREEEWTLTAVGESPQQTNSDDCGVFTITSARQVMLGYTPMSYGSAQIPTQRIRIVAELINRGLLKSASEG